MKVLLLILCSLFFSAGAAELRPLPWSGNNICRAVRFEANSSGKMRITDDPVEKAVRFEIAFPPGADRWVYPYLRLRATEPFTGVEQIRFEFRVQTKMKCRHAYVMFGEEKQYFSLPAPKTEYQSVTIPVASAVKNPAAVNDIRIGMNPEASDVVYYLRNLEFLTSKEPTRITDASLAVVAKSPGAVFLQGEALKFKLRPLAALPGKWSLKNWRNEMLRQGKWTGDNLVLEALPNGYYNLELEGFSGCRGFAVVPDPSTRLPNPHLYFAMDSAQSWLARPFPNNPRLPDNAYEIVSEVARRAGLQMVRERLHWDETTETSPGVLDWKQYVYNAELLAERGIKISDVYHDAPLWAKENRDAMLPCDLVATYNFAKKVAEDFRGKVSNWEFWNEQDSSGFTREGAWDYAAALKAACLGFNAGNPDLSVAIGGYTGTDNFSYADATMKNGAGEYFDIFNIHTYDALREYPEIMETVRVHMEQYGIEDLPVWFTENGTRIEGAGQLENWVSGLKRHSYNQELLLAEFLPKAMLTLQNLGVARDFFFVLPPYNEFGGRKDWGMMRRDFTVKPGVAAFATLVDKLGNATPEGEVKLGEGLKGYLYRQRDGSRTLVYWSCSSIDTDTPSPSVYMAAASTKMSAEDLLERSFKLPGVRRTLRGVNLFGTPQKVDSMKVTATRFPAILEHVDGLGVSVPARNPGTGKATDKAGLDKTVIFRTELSDDFEDFASRDCVNIKKSGARFKLQIWNLSAQPKVGRVCTTGGEFTALPPQITLPPFGKQEFELAFTPELRKGRAELRIDGSFNSCKATPLVIPVIDLGAILKVGRRRDMPRMLNPENWRKNSAGRMTISYDAIENAITFHTRFAPETKDRWSYPEFLLQLPDESQKNLLGVAFEVKVSRSADIKQMALMAVRDREHEAGDYAIISLSPPGEEWRECFASYLVPHLRPEKIKQLRLGVNTLSDDVTVSFRNIRFIYKD